MITTYGRSGPPITLIIVMGIALVGGCFLLWFAGLRFAEQQASQAAASQTADEQQVRAVTEAFRLPPSPTPTPECQWFRVIADRAGTRLCPDYTCQMKNVVFYDQQMCVLGVAEDDIRYPQATEWYVVDINASGAFRDLVYMHNSVLDPLNPTPTPTRTFTPLPTITLTPTFTPEPPKVVTATPLPDTTLLPPTITPTPERPSF